MYFPFVISRPDIANAASKLSQFLTNLSNHQIVYTNQHILYNGNIRDYSIDVNRRLLDPKQIFLSRCDASFDNNRDTRQSSQGYPLKLLNRLIHWKASKKKTVNTSSGEEEILAISATAK